MRKISYVIALLLISHLSFAIGDFHLRKAYEGKGLNGIFPTALKFLPKDMEKTAIDLGAGYGNETKALLETGFKVYAYDASEESADIFNERFASDKNLVFKHILFEDLDSLPKANIIFAINSLPFMDREKFPYLLNTIKSSLPKGGIFAGTFFGPNHYLKRSKTSHKIFRLSEEEIKELFEDFEIVYFSQYKQKDLQSSESWGSNQYDNRFWVIAVKK